MENSILIVDDNVENLKILGSVLMSEGYRIAIAKSGQETLELANNLIPSLVLLDVMMPGINGFEVARMLRQKESYKDVPIIFLTAKTEIEDIIEGFRSGGTDYITKPFNSSELKARIRNQLELKKAKDQIKTQSIELQRLNNFQNRIFSVISHDMRTPLATMNILLQNMRTDTTIQLSEKTMSYLNLMDVLTSETYQMFDNLFQWSRFQLKSAKPISVEFDISEQILNTIRLYDATAHQKNITLKYETTGKQMVFADENMIHAVLRNLINNAIKFSPPESEVTVTTKTQDEKTIVLIKDQGEGIDPSVLQNAFSEFDFQSHPGTQGEKGTGLGLKISANFIAMNNGILNASGTKGQGSVFSFSLPQKKL